MITNSMTALPPMSGSSSQSGFKMSTEQSDALNAELANYDSDNITDEDAKAITDTIKELGIEPGRELGTMLTEAGINPRGLAEQAGIAGPQKGSGEGGPPGGGKGGNGGPPPPGAGGPPKGEINSEAISALKLILEDYDSSDLSEDDWTEIITSLQEQGIDTAKPLLDIQA